MFLISPEWSDTFKSIKQIAVPKVMSDHRPVLLVNGDWEDNPSYFKFENMWLQEEGLTNGGRTTLSRVVQILFSLRN